MENQGSSICFHRFLELRIASLRMKMENQGSSICFHRFLELRIASLCMKICCLREENFNLEKLGFQEIVNPVSFSSLTFGGFVLLKYGVL
ncbi:hypothetical protein DVH24_005831 [Malus domestica]|uniref:Uncharacterized protein n=1 Tax=Malus domestica TaxID=3750 RepID=A0A498IJ47_MALDO|nr:hypothetical protein DVH24_005831 [Malus domestica]